VNAFFFIYFHNYFLMVFCHFGGLLLSIILMLYIPWFFIFEVLRGFFLLVHFVYF
jgi:hypothetical protein